MARCTRRGTAAASRQIKRNLTNSGPTSLLESWTAHWLDPNGDGNPSDGIDGYRLDHVLLDEGRGYTIGWWQHWKDALRAVNPDVFTFCEQADWGSHGAELLGPHDAAFTKPFLFAARTAISAGNATGLYNEMAATLASVPANRTYLGTLGDHDVDRLTTSLGNSNNRSKAAAAVLMLQPFPPVIDYGDELGMRGAKANYGSDNNDIPFREPFKWNAVAGAPMSNYFVLNSPAYPGSCRARQRRPFGAGGERRRDLGARDLSHARSPAAHACRAATRSLRRDPQREHGGVGVRAHRSERGDLPRRDQSHRCDSEHDARFCPHSPSRAVRVTYATWSRAPRSARSRPRTAVRSRSASPLTAIACSPRGSRRRSRRSPRRTTGLDIPTDFAPATRVAVQASPTSLGDNVNELDALYARPDSAGLSLGITGNLATDGSAIALFLDTTPGGQDSLATSTLPQPPSGLPQANGLGFDVGFAPDACLWINAFGGNLYADLYTLSTGGGGSKRYIGAGFAGNGFANLTGGTNPNGMVVALSNVNTLGVTATSASAPLTATSGLEARLPWADLGLSGPSTVKLCVAILKSDGFVGNQFLPPLTASSPSIGYPPASLKPIAGLQYVTIAATTAVPPSIAPLGFALHATPNPFREDARVMLSLPSPASLEVEVLDVTGRHVRTLAHGMSAAGPRTLRWDGRDETGRNLPAGLYLVRARTPEFTRVTRLARVR
jgi:hypothetical protein